VQLWGKRLLPIFEIPLEFPDQSDERAR
jgi:hypothetical protein